MVIDAPARMATERKASAPRDPIEWNDLRVWETRVERTEVAVELVASRRCCKSGRSSAGG